MDVSVHYRLTGSGWARCTLDIYGQTYTAIASYLSDALYEFLRGVNRILAGRTDARFSFDEEPGEYRWLLRSIEKGTLSIRILTFPEGWGEKPDSEGTLAFEATCPTWDFAHALLSSLNAMLEEYGPDGYEEGWGRHEFPADEYKALCSHLGATPLSLSRNRTYQRKRDRR